MSSPPNFGRSVYAALACSYSVGESIPTLEWRRRLYHWPIPGGDVSAGLGSGGVDTPATSPPRAATAMVTALALGVVAARAVVRGRRVDAVLASGLGLGAAVWYFLSEMHRAGGSLSCRT